MLAHQRKDPSPVRSFRPHRSPASGIMATAAIRRETRGSVLGETRPLSIAGVAGHTLTRWSGSAVASHAGLTRMLPGQSKGVHPAQRAAAAIEGCRRPPGGPVTLLAALIKSHLSVIGMRLRIVILRGMTAIAGGRRSAENPVVGARMTGSAVGQGVPTGQGQTSSSMANQELGWSPAKRSMTIRAGGAQLPAMSIQMTALALSIHCGVLAVAGEARCALMTPLQRITHQRVIEPCRGLVKGERPPSGGLMTVLAICHHLFYLRSSRQRSRCRTRRGTRLAVLPGQPCAQIVVAGTMAAATIAPAQPIKRHRPTISQRYLIMAFVAGEALM
jgi:hypothetical protein